MLFVVTVELPGVPAPGVPPGPVLALSITVTVAVVPEPTPTEAKEKPIAAMLVGRLPT
jgi:hypothetical protein